MYTPGMTIPYSGDPGGLHPKAATLLVPTPRVLDDKEAVAKVMSPTGIPVIPPAVVPWLTSVVGIAGILAASLPEHTVGARVAQLVFALGAALGLASPGLRRKQ